MNAPVDPRRTHPATSEISPDWRSSMEGWVLRPFVGNPGQPFEWFRDRQSNFFEAVWHTFWSLVR